MYELVGSICLGRTIGAQWETPDLQDVLMANVLFNFSRVYLQLKHPSQEQLLVADLNPLRTELSTYPNTVGKWLESIGDRALDFVDAPPNEKIRYAKYGNLVYENYQVEVAQAGINYPMESSKASWQDLRITRPNMTTDMSVIDTHCLVTVNGLIHPTVSNTKESFVLHGATSARMGGNFHCGLLSFLDIGALTKLSLREDQIHPFEPDSFLKDRIRITLDEDIGNKAFFLVLGGYLVFPDKTTFFQVGERSLSLNMEGLPYRERMLYGASKIDLSSLGFHYADGAPTHYSAKELSSDPVLRNYLRLPQSFLVFVDTPHLSIERIPVARSGYPNEYHSKDQPTYPLLGDFGIIYEYHKTEEIKCWVLTVAENFKYQYTFRETDLNQDILIDGAQDPTRVQDHVYGHMLAISGLKA